jgi:hypothetical protein
VKTVTMRHTLNCDAEAFWKHFQDTQLNEQIFKNDLHYPAYNVVERKDGAETMSQKISMQPPMDAPGPIKKLMGDGFKLTEEGTLDKKTGVYRFKAVPSSLSDKVSISGTVRVEPAGAGRCTRVVELSIDAKVFGLGGMIESTGAKNTEQGYGDYATALNKRLDAQAK